MSIIEITYRAYPEELEVEPYFPKCECGGSFRVFDQYNKKKVKQLTNATCKECGENFCGFNYQYLKDNIPRAQIRRRENENKN